ncbi:MAG TPA: GNAT family N-acetyltransferase [Polyangiaceae bacterium]|nr:GNAT family N-acetyltransferase [Polyangiaceae bacterium]
MQIGFAPTESAELRAEMHHHLASLPGAMDEFLEEHVRSSKHRVISVGGSRAGFASIHQGSLITQFSLEPAFQCFGQAAFHALRKLECVRTAFVPTYDEFYLSHAIDDYRQLTKQAYFFEALTKTHATGQAQEYRLHPANAAAEHLIRDRTGDLFGNLAERLQRGELFSTDRAGECVGFGVLSRSEYQPGVASIGMFTIERFRGLGVGTATISLLIEECTRRGLRAVAGCWYYNHASKRTLERAGMITKTRLLRLDY